MRPSKEFPGEWDAQGLLKGGCGDWSHCAEDFVTKCPYGQPGDRLWVRETWATAKKYDGSPPRDIPDDAPVWTGADGYLRGDGLAAGRTRASIHMPRWACRLVLEVVSVRVERVQDISEEDAKAEGLIIPSSLAVAALFGSLWDNTNGKGAWERNDWVWVVEFKVVPNA